MSLFYRRAIQKMLVHCSKFLTQKQLKDFVNKLNREDEISLHTQWELSLIYALSQSADIECEPNLGRKPDIMWRSKTTYIIFIADVRTISDEGLEKENSREFFRKELTKQVKKRGFDPGHFSDRPNHEMIGEYGDQKVRLKYPPKNEYQRLFNEEFHGFLNWVKTKKPGRAEKRLKANDFDVTIYYQRNIDGIRDGGGNICYTVYYSPKNNPIYNGLKKKANQLKKAKFKGIKGIFLTDGGCQQLISQMRDPAGRTYSDEQVILNFLKGSSSISFVMTVFAKPEQVLFSHFEPLKFQSKLFLNPRAHFPLPTECFKALQLIPQNMPKPKLDGLNAANHLRNGWDGPHKSWHASTIISEDAFMETIEFSSRSLLDLLAGKITNEQFCEMHNFKSIGGNFFERMLKAGLTIRGAEAQRLEDEDDDRIVLTFEPDFAAKPYETPTNDDVKNENREI